MLAGLISRDPRLPGSRVLDLCTGSGVLAIAAAQAGAERVTAVDLSRRAVATTLLNAAINRVRVEAVRGDLLKPVAGRRFDVIVSNPPYLPSEEDALPRHGQRRAWDAGANGRILLDRITREAPAHLSPGRRALARAFLGVRHRPHARLARGRGLDPSVAETARGPLGPLLAARAPMLAAERTDRPGHRATRSWWPSERWPPDSTPLAGYSPAMRAPAIAVVARGGDARGLRQRRGRGRRHRAQLPRLGCGGDGRACSELSRSTRETLEKDETAPCPKRWRTRLSGESESRHQRRVGGQGAPARTRPQTPSRRRLQAGRPRGALRMRARVMTRACSRSTSRSSCWASCSTSRSGWPHADAPRDPRQRAVDLLPGAVRPSGRLSGARRLARLQQRPAPPRQRADLIRALPVLVGDGPGAP